MVKPEEYSKTGKRYLQEAGKKSKNRQGTPNKYPQIVGRKGLNVRLR